MIKLGFSGESPPHSSKILLICGTRRGAVNMQALASDYHEIQLVMWRVPRLCAIRPAGPAETRLGKKPTKNALYVAYRELIESL